jgi:hypothetical protein
MVSWFQAGNQTLSCSLLKKDNAPERMTFQARTGNLRQVSDG